MQHLIHRFYLEMWNKWDDGVVDDVLSAHFQFRGSLGTETVGRDGWRAYRDSVRQGAADFHNKLESLIVEGSRAAARLTFSGTHSGVLAGIEPTGRRFSYSGAAFFVCDRDQLVSAWVLGDIQALRGQLAS